LLLVFEELLMPELLRLLQGEKKQLMDTYFSSKSQ
jgi:hypothetical protein